MLKKITLLLIAVCLAITLGCIEEGPQNGSPDDEVTPVDGVYVIVGKTETKHEAIRKADQFISDGYDCGVYEIPSGYYVIALGKYSQAKADQVRTEAINKGIVSEQETYISNGESFGNKTYPAGTGAQNIITDNMYYVVADSSRDKKKALKRANNLIAEGFYSEVFLKSNRYYIVTIGHFPRERALNVREGALQFNFVDEGAYLSNGDGFVERTYTFKNADNDVVFADLQREENSPGKKRVLPPVEAPQDTIVEKEEYGGMATRQDNDKFDWPENDPLDRDNYNDVDMSDSARFNRDDHDNYRPKKGSKFNREKKDDGDR